MYNIYDYYITHEDYARAAEYGVSQSLLCERVRRLCWDKERAITTPPKPKRSIIPQIVRDLAEQNGIPFPLLSQRVHNGWSLYRAATTPKQVKPNPPVKRNPYAAIARKNGIKYATFRYRIKTGWPPEIAATKPTMTKSEIARMVNSKSDHPWKVDNKIVFYKEKTP